MRSTLKLALGLCLAGALAACSTSNTSQSPSPDWREGSAFSITSIPGSGMFTPVLEVAEDSTGATVTVSLEDAASVASAYVEVRYDAGRFTPAQVNFTELLGAEGDTLTLAVTSRPGVLPLGATQVRGAAVMPVSGSGVLATIRFDYGAFAGRVASKAPSGSGNAVDDLIIVSQTGLSADLQWTEHHVGDYDNNGEVNIADMTPLGLFFNETVATSDDQDFARMVDGDGNGEVNLADLTPIGSNYGSTISGYIVYTDPEGTQPVGSGVTVDRQDQDPEIGTPTVYQYTALLGGGSPSFNVRPVNAAEMSSPGPQSNIAQIVNQSGPPLAPTNLIADSGQILGPGKIKLTWTPSGSADVGKYIIERKLTSEDDTAWVQVGETTGATTTYTDTGLAEDSYDYRVWAEDFTAERSAQPSNTDSNTPYVVVISPPQNPQAVSGGAGAHSIMVNWDPPADSSAAKFKVYKKGPLDSAFALLGTTINQTITDWPDSACTAGETYEYYITGTDPTGAIESLPTSTVSAVASPDAPPISITDLTTSKWTHHQNGSETPATLTVTTDTPADSVVWTASAGGNPSGSGNTASWSPSGTPALGKVTITCTVTNVSGSDNATIDLVVTDMAIKTNLGNAGKAPDISGSVLDALASGGSISNGTLYGVIQGNVALVKEWESW